MTTAESVLLPAPLGPMTACTSPERTVRSMPLRICLPATEATRPLISSVLTVATSTGRCSTSTARAVDHGGDVDGHRLGGGQGGGSPVTRLKALPCFQHSSLLLVAPHLALAERDVGVAARVADGVDVVADAHDRDRRGRRRRTGWRCRARGRRARTTCDAHAAPPAASLLRPRGRAGRRAASRPAARRARRRRSRARRGARRSRAGCRGSRGRSAARRRSGRPCWRGCTSRRWSGCRGSARSRPRRPR